MYGNVASKMHKLQGIHELVSTYVVRIKSLPIHA